MAHLRVGVTYKRRPTCRSIAITWRGYVNWPNCNWLTINDFICLISINTRQGLEKLEKNYRLDHIIFEWVN